jgi:hypothetical protein
VPKVSNYVQLTHDGQPKWLVGTDDSRLYLGVGSIWGGAGVSEISVSGGELTRTSTPSPAMFPSDLSRDGSNLLVADQELGAPQGRSGVSPFLEVPRAGWETQ